MRSFFLPPQSLVVVQGSLDQRDCLVGREGERRLAILRVGVRPRQIRKGTGGLQVVVRGLLLLDQSSLDP